MNRALRNARRAAKRTARRRQKLEERVRRALTPPYHATDVLDLMIRYYEYHPNLYYNGRRVSRVELDHGLTYHHIHIRYYDEELP